jgi:hypothetical protein
VTGVIVAFLAQSFASCPKRQWIAKFNFSEQRLDKFNQLLQDQNLYAQKAGAKPILV